MNDIDMSTWRRKYSLVADQIDVCHLIIEVHLLVSVMSIGDRDRYFYLVDALMFVTSVYAY